jgi:hypothetical protein
MKLDGVHQDMNHVSIHETRYARPYEYKKHSSITGQVLYLERNPGTRETTVLCTSQDMTVVVVRETAESLC